MRTHIAVLLHNIRSAHNVGSIFRTAEGAGAERIYLSGYTPAPLDRFGRVRKDIAKTSLGAQMSLSWEQSASPFSVLAKLRGGGWTIIGVEQDKKAIDYRTFKTRKPTLFIFGNEVRGIPPALRAKCDKLIEIPMHGKKESLNVSVAAGIVLFRAVE
ncbi:MAG: TrmH family RNA methyltransferase [bacterium]|nr:TrmH family RNA methyltransferase [bacterium]